MIFNVIKAILDFAEGVRCACRDNHCNCFIFKSYMRRRNRNNCPYCNKQFIQIGNYASHYGDNDFERHVCKDCLIELSITGKAF